MGERVHTSWSAMRRTVLREKCLLRNLNMSSSEGPSRSRIMTSKSPCFPDHMIQGIPGEPERVLYILDSCRMGLLRGTVGCSLMATSFPATVWVPRYTEPGVGIEHQGGELGDQNARNVPQPPFAITSSILYLPPKVCCMARGL